MPRGTDFAVVFLIVLYPMSIHAADRPPVFPTDNHASSLLADERDEFILRVSAAAATGMYRKLFSGSENQLFGDGGTVYRSRDYNQNMRKNYGNSGDRSPHRTELAADVGMRTLNPGKTLEWLQVLKENGLSIPFLWDPVHVEPMPGTDLFNVRADSLNPYGRESYMAQADHLLKMRDLVAENPDLYPFLDAFPNHTVGTEEEAIAAVGFFHENFSRVLIQQKSETKRAAAFGSFKSVFNQTNSRRYKVPQSDARDPGPVRRDTFQIRIFQGPYEIGIPNYLKYLLSAEQYSVEVARASAKRSLDAQLSAAEERRRAEISRRDAERRQREFDRISQIREPRLLRRDPDLPRRDPDLPRRHQPYTPPEREQGPRLGNKG